MKSILFHPDSKNLNAASKFVLKSKGLEGNYDEVEDLKYRNKPSDIYREAKKQGFKLK